MDDVEVTPEKLEEFAKSLDTAADLSLGARNLGVDLQNVLWRSHGVISCSSSAPAIKAKHRRDIALAIAAQTCVQMAKDLRKAAEAYTNVDSALAGNFNRQVLPE